MFSMGPLFFLPFMPFSGVHPPRAKPADSVDETMFLSRTNDSRVEFIVAVAERGCVWARADSLYFRAQIKGGVPYQDSV